ncbi:MAG TPA: AAA family ATPase [Candidatus Limnocylindria bacterium]|nr:AAA family ATPase [Candidatus Limnocylindria bacterium]
MSARVLLLSVDGAAQPAIKEVLRDSGADVTVTEDPAVAKGQALDHQLLIVDAATDEDVGRLLQELRQATDAGGDARPRILAIVSSEDIEQRVALLERGADDVVVQPFDPRQLEAMVEALLLQAAPARQPTEGMAPVTPAHGGQPQGQVFVFAAAKGGVGSTTLAVNTALALAEGVKSGVALADLDFQRGQVATYLDVQPRSTTVDLARDEQALADAQYLRQSAVQHASGLHVLAAPSRPDLGATLDHEHALSLLRALRAAFPIVVVDAGSVLDWRALALMEAADRAVITVTAEIPSLRLLHGALEVLSGGEVSTERTLFVLNHIFPRQMVTAEQIQEHLGVKVGLEIPYDPELYLTAANEGQPIMNSAPRSPQAAAMRRLAAILRGEEAAPENGGTAARKSRLGGLLKRG